MNVQQRIDLLVKLGDYIQMNPEEWQQAKDTAYIKNQWFIPQFIELATQNIVTAFLQKSALQQLAQTYNVPDEQPLVKKVGLVMAGNIPLVGFHDFLCVFISGHRLLIKPSSKDEVLIQNIVRKLIEWNKDVQLFISFAELLKNCDAYIATGSNNSARYFEFYFSRYPHIIRKNRTSVAILDGAETTEELLLLASDIQLYFGLGCRNVTKLFVPDGYNFIPLLEALKQYSYYTDFNKYKNNYDYQLALLIMSNRFYMNNDSILLTEDASLFTPVSRVNYSFYNDEKETLAVLAGNDDVQCIVGRNHTPFGKAQNPCLTDFADGVDTMDFLVKPSPGFEL